MIMQRKSVVMAALLSMVCGLGVFQAGSAEAAARGCTPIWYIGARGSGEPATVHHHPIYHGMGHEVYDMATVVGTDLQAKGLGMSLLADTYNADSVDELLPNAQVLADISGGKYALATAEYIHSSVNRYDASIQQGISNAEYAVHTVLADCPGARIIMAGYSQGAIAMHDAENYLALHQPGEFSHIAGTLLLGDGDRVPDTKAKQFGTSSASAEGLRVYLHLVQAHDVPDPATTANIANADDIVADFALLHLLHARAAAKVHTSYADTAGEKLLADAAHWVARKVLSGTSPTITAASFSDSGIPLTYTPPAGTATSKIIDYRCEASPDGGSTVYPCDGGSGPSGGIGTADPATAPVMIYIDPGYLQIAPGWSMAMAAVTNGGPGPFGPWFTLTNPLHAPVIQSVVDGPEGDGMTLTYKPPAPVAGLTIRDYECQVSPDGGKTVYPCDGGGGPDNGFGTADPANVPNMVYNGTGYLYVQPGWSIRIWAVTDTLLGSKTRWYPVS